MAAGRGRSKLSAVARLGRLLARERDPNRPDWLGKTYLHACAGNGDRSAAAIFLKAGADINARDVEFQGTPLAAAVRSCIDAQNDPKQATCSRRTIAFLLKRGAATNLPGDEPWATWLAWARTRGLVDVEKMHLEHGGPLLLTSVRQGSPLAPREAVRKRRLV